MRCAAVASGITNAHAISSVVRPQRTRSVRATRLSALSEGWQDMKMSRSRSSPTSSSAASSIAPAARSCRSAMACTISGSFSSQRRWRSTRFSARFFATCMSHAPGSRGMPSRGQVSSAARNASWASSSAVPRSPRTNRASPATSRGHSIRKTASTRRCVSSMRRAGAASALAVFLVCLCAELRVLLAEPAGRIDRREVFVREELTDLERAALGGRRAAHPGDRLVERLALDDGEARNELLRLGERTVLDRRLAALSERDPRTLRGRLQPFACDEHARLHELLDELAHLGELRAAREHAGFAVLGRVAENYEFHGGYLFYPDDQPRAPGSTRASKIFRGCRPCYFFAPALPACFSA